VYVPSISTRSTAGESTIRALVFDFDGLILDTESAEHQAAEEIYLEHGTELSRERWLDCSRSGGQTVLCDQLERQLGELVDRDRIARRQRARAAEILESRSALPGVTEFIQRARELDMHLAVTSSSTGRSVERHLRRMFLFDHFDDVRTVEDVHRFKPDPEIYFALCGALHVAPEEAIAIEDSPPGIAAAKAAGLYCISVPNARTRSLSMDAADLVLVSLAMTSLDEVIDRAQRRRAS
jgi:HAD superfamily hydrolase (TIGR01509 family)